MNTLSQILLALIITALIAIFAVPYFIDWNQYKSEIEAQASKIVGYDLAVAGDVNLRLLPAPYLQLEDITVKAPKGHENTPPFKAKAFKLWLSAPPLLRGVIEVQEVELIKPQLAFAIDQNGQSNWQRGAGESGVQLPFTPKSISLQSMIIRDGSLDILSAAMANGKGLHLTHLNGDFSAGSLKGPFKFDGTTGAKGQHRILRFSTGRIEDKGEMRFKALLRPAVGSQTGISAQRYSFDGSLNKLKNNPAIEGVLTVKYPFFKQAKGFKALLQGKDSVKPVEIKTAVNMNANGASFDKILVTIVHKNRPQMMTGKGHLAWNEGKVDLQGHLKSRLLDLDHLKSGMKVGNSVSEAIGNLFAQLQMQARRVDTGHFSIRIDQIKLNGDLISDIDFDLQQGEQGLAVKKLFASLPGDNAIKVTGHFAETAQDKDQSSPFIGDVILRGQSLGRLVTWAAGTRIGGNNNAISSRPFTLRGHLTFGALLWALEQAHGDIAGTSFEGALRYVKSPDEGDNSTSSAAWSRPGKLELQLATSEIDSTALIGRPVAMRELIASAMGRKTADTDKSGKSNKGLASLLKNKTLKLQLRAGRIKMADFDGQDLVADIFYGLDRLQINQLSLGSAKGMRLAADGSIDSLEKNPGGALAATINIPTAFDLKTFTSWFAPDNNSALSKRQIKSLTPLRLAVMLQTGESMGSGASLRINGIAGSSKISLNNQIIGKNLFSRQGKRHIEQVELSGVLSNTDGRILLSQLVPYLPINRSQLAKIGKSKVWLSASGLPKDGLNSRIEFNSNKLSAGLDGQLGWQKGESRFTGRTHLETKDIAAGLAFVGIDARGIDASGGLKLTANLDKQPGLYNFTKIDGSIASSDVQGQARLAISPPAKDGDGKKQQQLDLTLLTSSLHLPSLFAPLQERPAKPDENTELAAASQLSSQMQDNLGAVDGAQKAIMSARRFSPERLQNISARIFLTADKLFLSDTIFLRHGDLSAHVENSKISFDNIGGSLWGGRMKSHGELDLAPTIPTISGAMSITEADLDLAPFEIDASKIISGKASLESDFNGRGISPAGLFSLLNGKGHVLVKQGSINRFSATVLRDVVTDELAMWDQAENKSSFKERFRRHLLRADFDLNDQKMPFIIKDGTLELNSTQKSGKGSKLDIDASLTLSTLATHTRLTITPAQDISSENLPPASVLYEGSLIHLDKISPKLETDSLEQNLQVMKMEHDVNLLEKLHKRDDDFAREAARRREQKISGETQDSMSGQKQDGMADSVGDGMAKPKQKRNWQPFNDSISGMGTGGMR